MERVLGFCFLDMEITEDLTLAVNIKRSSKECISQESYRKVTSLKKCSFMDDLFVGSCSIAFFLGFSSCIAVKVYSSENGQVCLADSWIYTHPFERTFLLCIR